MGAFPTRALLILVLISDVREIPQNVNDKEYSEKNDFIKHLVLLTVGLLSVGPSWTLNVTAEALSSPCLAFLNIFLLSFHHPGVYLEGIFGCPSMPTTIHATTYTQDGS